MKEKSNKHFFIKSSIWLLFIITISKLLGFIREMIVAGYYGATYETDAYFLSASMPATIFPAICTSASIVFSSQYITQRNKDSTKLNSYVSNAMTYLGAFSLILSICAIIIMPLFVKILAPGFDEKTIDLTVFMSRCTVSVFVFTMFHYILSGILSAEKKPVANQVIGLLTNLSIILFTIFFNKYLGIYALLSGLIVSELLIFVVMLFNTPEPKEKFRLNFSFTPEIRTMIKLIIPVILGNAAGQISQIVDRFLSSLSSSGAVSVMTYGMTLYNLVVTIYMTLVSALFFPEITDLIVKKKNTRVFSVTNRIINIGVFILAFITVITYICSENIVAFIYERGSFSHDDTIFVASILKCYSLGFIPQFIREIYIKILYGSNRNTEVMKNGIYTMIANVFFSILLFKFVGIYGIPLGTSLSSFLSIMLLYKDITTVYSKYSVFKGNGVLLITILLIPILVLIVGTLSRNIKIGNSFIELCLITVISFILWLGIICGMWILKKRGINGTK